MRKQTKVIISISSVVLFFVLLYFSMSFSNHLVIKRTIFLNGYPIEAFTTDIQDKPDSKSNKYGKCYVIDNPKVNNGTEQAVPGVCMKKSKFGFYYDITIGVF
ncbi:hypothetical protein [Virgibacillus ndiopensis]|uniref:hypothetical protein n=1 Tax=Virgibacillus ndiopensis TaxID=2004408 RepID=UPI000C07F21E|nr:hypothetical protein [Virgibacillus ndiopensis]